MIVSLARDVTAGQLVTSMAPHVARIGTGMAMRTPWGAVAVADGPSWRVGDWLVAGYPQVHPWGVPGADLSGSEVAAELNRYGPAAIQMTSGPFVAVDLLTGSVLRAMNGIVPVVVSVRPNWVASTSAEAAASIASGPLRAVPAGHFASPDGMVTSACGTFVGESVPEVNWAGIASEVNSVLAPLGALKRLQLAGAPSPDCRVHAQRVWSAPQPGRAIFSPRLAARVRTGRELTDYFSIRENVLPKLWWRARLTGHWLCAPAFERPALELVAFLAGDGRD